MDSRLVREGRVIRRRRQCERCNVRFTTYEGIDETAPVIVKKDGRREAYDRQKLLAGLTLACQKRPIPRATIEAFVDDLESRLLDGSAPEVASRRLGEAASGFLKDVDPIAYIRFASVYHSFSDLEQLLAEIHGLIGQEPTE